MAIQKESKKQGITNAERKILIYHRMKLKNISYADACKEIEDNYVVIKKLNNRQELKKEKDFRKEFDKLKGNGEDKDEDY